MAHSGLEKINMLDFISLPQGQYGKYNIFTVLCYLFVLVGEKLLYIVDVKSRVRLCEKPTKSPFAFTSRFVSKTYRYTFPLPPTS